MTDPQIDLYRYRVVADAITRPGDLAITLVCVDCDDTHDQEARIHTFDVKWPSIENLHEIARIHDRQHPTAPAGEETPHA
ncbi:hypothetical protein OG552_10355 [Streptomyces sp. NBC_01476]|uniref:hypothetical protein n=1 Tax=Streptomyces sp. NBC_01476 TaxID=2903881 RepID=UPI002E31EC34|nr:hypothetical protein [Streptomyces sp. NBC_01476]